MSSYFASSHHMPCTECGASVPAGERKRHVCDPQRVVEYRLFQARDEVAAFEDDFQRYLGSAAGQFAQWLAEHERTG